MSQVFLTRSTHRGRATALMSITSLALSLLALTLSLTPAVQASAQERLAVNPPADGNAPAPPATPKVHHNEAASEPQSPPIEASAEAVAFAEASTGTSYESEVSSDEDMSLEEAIAAATKYAAAEDTSEDAATDIASAPPMNENPPEVVELSVPPSREMLPADLPAWVSQAPDYSTATHRFSVGSDAVDDPKDLEPSINRSLMASVLDYLDQKVFEEQGVAGELGLTSTYIKRNLLSESANYVAPIESSFGTSYVKWVMVEVTPEQRVRFQQMRAESIQRTRMPIVGLGVLALVSVLGVSHLMIRRGTSTPSKQPLSGPNFVSQQVPAKRSKGGVLALLFFLVSGVALVGLLGAFALLATRVEVQELPMVAEQRPIGTLGGSRQSVIISRDGRTVTVQGQSDIPAHVREDVAETIERVFESNGQQIIERVIPNP